MKNKKVMALILAITMVAGSSMTAFASQTTGTIESEGTSYDHVDQEVIAVTLPTSSTLATVFDYYADPEGTIKSAGTLLDGTTVTANNDGVYFQNAGAAAVPGTVSSSIAADTNRDYVVTVDDLTVNETYTYVDTPAQDGTISSNIAADTNSDYDVTVDDLSVNDTYTFDGSDWKGSDGNIATVTITVMQNDGSTPGTVASGDTVTVSGAQPAVQEWQDSDGNTATVTIDVKKSDNTAGTVANGDTVTVNGATAAGDAGYSSTSDAVIFEGNNSVDMDVTVAATVDTTNAAKDITLVADEDALAAATGPALLMNLKVGTETKAITTAGVSAKATVAGVPGNFKMVPNSAGTQFEYGLKDAADLTAWNSTTVQLSGKTNDKDIPAGAGAMTVPKVTLTWTIAKHVSGPQVTLSDEGVITMTGLTAAKNYASSAVLTVDGADSELDSDENMTWDTSGWDETDGGTLIFRLNQAWLDALDGKEASLTVTLSDESTITTTHQF